MSELAVTKPAVLDIIDTKSPALSSTTDMPVIETKPDASNEGKPPEKKAPEAKAAPEAPAKADADGKTKGESATPPAEPAADDDVPEKKPAKGVQKRLDELTRQREEAERRAKAAEENLTRALEAMKAKPQQDAAAPEAPKKPVESEPEPQRPNRADFTDPEAWDKALLDYADQRAEWVADNRVKKDRAEQEQTRVEKAAREAQQTMFDAHNKRVAVAKAKYADFQQVAENPDVSVSVPMAHAIIAHEQGPDIAYFLGANPAEAARIAALPEPAQLVEMGLIAYQFRDKAKAAAPAAPAQAPKPISAAPAPVNPKPAGSGDAATKSPEEMSMEEYAAMRKPQLAEGSRPGARRYR